MLAHDRSVASPEAAGVDPAKFEALCARAARAVEEAGLPAAQLAVARNGRIAARRNFGAAADDTLFVIFSCSKAITSVRGRITCRVSMFPNFTMPFRMRCSSVVVLASFVTCCAPPSSSSPLWKLLTTAPKCRARYATR